MLHVSQYTFAELNQMRITKGELFSELKSQGIEFDYAIPENWADEFHAFCQKHNPLVTYHLIISTTVWTYEKHKSIFGYPMSCCKEVTELLEIYQC